ncbi:MAG: conserved protein of unknown function [Nitrospira sp.]
MDTQTTGEFLTNDEKKAAEAAFTRRPFNPIWSARARTVYDGIVKALPQISDIETDSPTDHHVSAANDSAAQHAADPETESSEPGSSRHGEPAQKLESSVLPEGIPVAQALETGALIDVTPAAKQLGFSFAVNLTRTLWKTGIAPNGITTQEEQSARLRDVLMALRLRLAAQATISPLIDFPALLTIPPNTVPQPVPLFALLQPNGQDGMMITVLLPNEVSTTIIPMG